MKSFVRRHIKAIIVLAVIVFAVSAFFIIRLNPRMAFEGRFQFKLPDSAKIINYELYLSKDRFLMKASFDAEDFDAVKQGIESFGASDMTRYKLKPAFDGAPWWDYDRDNLVMAHESYLKDGWPYISRSMSRYVYLIVTQDADGQYYLFAKY